MVGKSYLLAKPPGPSALKRRFDQAFIPAALNAVAPVEAALTRASERARTRPAAAIAVALSLGYLARLLSWRHGARRWGRSHRG